MKDFRINVKTFLLKREGVLKNRDGVSRECCQNKSDTKAQK